MRIRFIIFLCLLRITASAQDKTILEKQLLDIMIDYPNKFSHLKSKKDTLLLNFQISGTRPQAMILGTGNKAYITADLNIPRSKAEAETLYTKWVSLINSITMNGAQLTSKNCPSDQFTLFCKKWTIDNSKNNIAPAYIPFTIQVEVINVLGSFAATLKAGDL